MKNSAIKELWLDFRGIRIENSTTLFCITQDSPNLFISLTKFIWNADSVEDFVSCCSFYLNQKISLYVTNNSEDFFNMEQFKERDILVGFGGTGAACLASEFFLNLGLEKSDVNYEYIKDGYLRNLADDNSCEIRAQVIH